jgi:eukaryotic-like serine/threonine-protein kinase
MNSETTAAIAVGQHVGPYRIDRVLGTGGMGVVYLAEDRELRRKVAIKVVDRARCGEDATRLLLAEARVTAALNHPSICGVHEVGRLGDERFIVMEHVEGTLLSKVIARECGVPLEIALHYALQIADAVAHAHSHGVTHGDLKTSNVIVARDGTVKILDFGLAIRRGPVRGSDDYDTTRRPESGSGVGTVPYMAPELLRGARADVHSDVWALGVMFFELLTGARPFRGGTVYELAASILSDQPAELPQRLPATLRAIVRRCLAKEPANRYPTARELAGALDDVD